jgi:hypothetical protein
MAPAIWLYSPRVDEDVDAKVGTRTEDKLQSRREGDTRFSVDQGGNGINYCIGFVQLRSVSAVAVGSGGGVSTGFIWEEIPLLRPLHYINIVE